MSDSANYPENGTGAADPTAPKLGRVQTLSLRRDGRSDRGLTRGLRLWARRNFSRKQLLTSLKTLLWVVPLTILIWIYAEREQQFTAPSVTIPIEITTNDPNRLVILRRPDQPLVMATITGPRSGVEDVMHSWDPNGGGGAVRIEIDRNLGTGENRIDASVIGNDPRFASHGVSVSSCQPAWLDVVIDSIVERQIAVKAVNVPSNVGSVTFSPPTIKVRGPQTFLDEAAAAGTLFAEADFSHQGDLAAADPSVHTIAVPDVKLTLPVKSHDITIVGTPVVGGEVKLKSGKELPLATVTLEVATTRQVMDNYQINFPATLLDVTVTGPEDKIALLAPSNPDSFKYRKATFEVTQDDILTSVGSSKTVPVEFKFPPGVQYKSGPSTVTFTWVDRHNSQ